MTYQDALKARARIAYGNMGLNKSAAEPDAVRQARETATAASKKPIFDQVRKNTIGFNGDTSDNENALAAFIPVFQQYGITPEEVSAVVEQARGIRSQQDINRISNETPGAANFSVPVGDSKAIQNAVQVAKENQKDIQTATAKAPRNAGIGVGAGLLGGAAVGAGAYGLTGLFPSLRKRRLLRALIALGVGGAAGTGIGLATTRGLNVNVANKALGSISDRVSQFHQKNG